MKRRQRTWVILPALLVALSWQGSGVAFGAMSAKRSVLANGMVLLTAEQRALPMVSIELLVDAGARHENASQAGLAHLTAKLLTYGTNKRSAVQTSDALDFIGASLDAACGDDSATISMTILKKDLAVGLDILADILTGASFPQLEVDRQKQAVLAAIMAKGEDPGTLASEAFAAALFPASAYGRPLEGSEATVKPLQRAHLREFFQRHYRPNRTIMSVVGDVSEAEISAALTQALRGWKPGQPSQTPAPPEAQDNPRTVAIQRDLTQANIILGHRGVPRSNPDYYAIQVMNYILGGGGFSSRALDSIRNERGLAYSVYSFFSAYKSYGSFQFVMQTKNDSAREAIKLAIGEIERLRAEPVSDSELSDAKNYLIGSYPLNFDTNRKVAGFLTQVEYFGLGLDFAQRYGDLIAKVTREDMQRAAKLYLHPDRLFTIIVGNLTKIGSK